HGPHANTWAQDGRRGSVDLSTHQCPQSVQVVSSYAEGSSPCGLVLLMRAWGLGNGSDSSRNRRDDPAHGRSPRIPLGKGCHTSNNIQDWTTIASNIYSSRAAPQNDRGG